MNSTKAELAAAFASGSPLLLTRPVDAIQNGTSKG